jgi:hypothetical protein
MSLNLPMNKVIEKERSIPLKTMYFRRMK